MPPVRRAVVAAGCALLMAGLATACSPGGGGPTSSAPSASPTTVAPEPTTALPPASETADAAEVRSRGPAITADGVTVLHVLRGNAGTTVHAQAEAEQTVLTLDPGGADLPLEVLLAVPDGATLQPQEDGSLLVLAGDGTFLGGTAHPVAGTGATQPHVEPVTDGVVRVEATGSVTTHVGSSAIVGTDWGDREGGRSLAVEPTPWARTAGLAGEAAVWAELIEAVPEADTEVMHDQLVCHAVGAPDKATWNLEPWRPDIGVLKTMLAACNPT